MPAKQANSPQIFTDNYISQFSGQRKGSIFSLSLIHFYFYRYLFIFPNLSKTRPEEALHIFLRSAFLISYVFHTLISVPFWNVTRTSSLL